MALFGRKAPSAVDAPVSEEFERLSIRQVILHGYLVNRTIFVHCEKNGVNYFQHLLILKKK